MTSQGYKEIALDAAALLLAVIVVLGWAAVFTAGAFSWAAGVLLVIGTAIVIAFLAVALAVARRVAGTLVILFGLPLIVIAAGRAALPSVIGAMLLLLFVASARGLITQEVKSRIRYQTILIFPGAVRLLIAGMVIAILGLNVPWILQRVQQGGFLKTNETVVGWVLSLAQPLMRSSIPGFTPAMTVDEMVDKQIAEQANGLPIPPDVIEAQRARVRFELGRQFNQTLTGRESLSAVFTRVVNDTINSAVQGNTLLLLIGIVVSVILTLRVFLPLLAWPLLGLIALTVWGAKSSGILRLAETSATKEQLEIG